MRIPSRSLVLLLTALLGSAAAQEKSPEEFIGDKPAPSRPAAANPGAAKAPAQAATKAPARTAPVAAPAGTPAPAAGKPARARAVPPFDTARIHEQYLEGDFDLAIRALEIQLAAKRPMSHAESVFTFKHLGVMYAASHSTREKGKEFMQKLIHIEPTAKILDMYASDMIHLIFRNVQEEFEAKRARLRPAPETVVVAQAPPPAPDPNPAPAPAAASPTSSRNRRTLYMAAAGAGVAVGAFTLFMLLSDDEPKTRTIVVNE